MNKLTASLILLLSGLALAGYGQKAVIKVIDSRSREPISFAHVQLENLNKENRQTVTTNIDGIADNPVQVKSLISITYVGFRNYYDTLFPGQSVTVSMQPMVYNMDEVVVTGQFTPQPVDKSIYRVKVIGSRQIENKASSNLGEMMASELNIRSMHDGALGSKITMQGLGGEHIKLLIDGVPVIGRMNGNIDLGQLNLYNVQHIEIIEGPMSVIYGSNALAGVINIITKENSNLRNSANGSAYIESVGVYNLNADASVSKNRWFASVGAARNFFGGYSAIDTSRSKSWKPKRQYNADFTTQYSHKELKVSITTSYFNELLLDKGNLRKPYFENAFDSHFKVNRLTSKLDLSTRLFKDRYLNLLASYSFYDRTKNTYFNDLTIPEKKLTKNISDHDTSSFGQYLIRAEFSKSTNNSPFNYQLGIDLNYEDGKGKRILDQKQAIGDYAAFLSLKIQPSLRWMLQPGLRYSYNTRYTAPLVYSLNTKWDISEPITLRLSYARGFRAPSLKELYLEFVDINHNIRGNENLKAEYSQNINLALKLNQEKDTYDYGFELNLFYNNISNSIDLAVIDAEKALYTYVNIRKMITQGGQLNFNNRLYPWLELRLGIGETGRKELLDTDEQLSFIYSTDFMANVTYLWRKTNVNFNVNYKYNGDYPDIFLGTDGLVLRTIMKGYHSMDITASKWIWQNRINLQIGAKNLFDNTTISSRGDIDAGGIHSGGGGATSVDWGRTYFVKLSFSFKQF